jgi:cell division protein FtsW (lipid II flippase)
MAVTISTAADRRRRPLALSLAAARTREALLLSAGAAVALLGWLLVFVAAGRTLEGVGERLATGEVVNLNALTGPAPLLPHLAFLPDPGERELVAERIWRRAQAGSFPNVGELAKIRVSPNDLATAGKVPGLRGRLEAATAGKEGAGVTVPLLTLSQLRQVKPGLVVRAPGSFRLQFWLWGLAMLAVFAAVHLGWRRFRFAGDQILLPAVLVLCGLGFAMMTSVRDPLRDIALFASFAQGVVAGGVLLFLASFLEIERSPLRRLSWLALPLALLISTLLVLFGSGPGTSDAKVNLFGMQPVEAVKILVVLFLAGYLYDRWELLREVSDKRPGLARFARWVRIPRLEYALPPFVALAAILFFFFLQKDLGPALVLSFLFLLLYAVARGRSGVLAAGTAAVVGAFAAGYALGVPRTVSLRIAMWLSPWENAFRGGDHLAHSLWSLAGGGVAGAGLGLGQPSRVPEIHTDMVLAALGEELGFLGLLAVFALYAVVVTRAFRAALRAQGVFSFFLALGLALVTALQILLISGGVTGLLPLSGVVSPFLSYGRSAMLANFLVVGLLLAVSARAGERAGDGETETLRRFRVPVKAVAFGLAALLGAVVLRAAQVQVFQDEDVMTRGALTLQGDGFRRYQYNPRLAEIAGTIPRGAIVDRNGLPLAVEDVAELEPHRAELEALGVSLEELQRQKAAGASRLYPFGERAFHLLGDLRTQVNWAAPNTSYAERDSRVRLQGYDDYAGVVSVPQPDGSTLPVVKVDYGELVPVLRHRHQPEHPAVRAILDRDRTLKMTVDARLQLRAGEILEKYAKAAGRDAGAAAVLLDADTGDLLAAVSYPWPKRLPAAAADPGGSDAGLIDRARYGIYPPGSTFKVVTALAALQKDPDLAAETFQCRRLPDGRVGNTVRGWGRPMRDDPTVHAPHGSVNLEKGITQSCNAYFAQLATYEVGAEQLLATAERMGIETAQPNTPEQLKDALPQAGYGQGQVTATPFEMARVAATLANRGAMPEGRWVLDATNTRNAPPADVLTGPSVELIARSMRQVATQGTASRIFGGFTPAVAGKTGTAEVQGKPSHSWFIGFAPYDAPPDQRIAFAVIVEHGGYGGRLAAQAAKEMVEAAVALGVVGGAGGAGGER